MRVVVTGAGGFLGQKLLEQLALTDIEVLACSSQWKTLKKKHSEAQNLTFCSDCTNYPAELPFKKGDILVHCAFPCGDNDGIHMTHGLAFGASVLSKAATSGIDAFINISSQSVYDPNRAEPADELSEVVAHSHYAVGKYAMERMTDAVLQNTPHTSLRLASLIGKGTGLRRMIDRFVDMVKAGDQLTIMEVGQRFGFLDVRDAASSILACARKDPQTWEDVYNVGPERSYTITEIAQTVMRVGKELGYSVKAPQYADGEKVTKNSSLCARKFMQAFDWKPVFSLEDTVKEMFEALRG